MSTQPVTTRFATTTSEAPQSDRMTRRHRGEEEVSSMSVMTRELPEVTTEHELPCRRYDGELWFAESPADVERAKSLCERCPLRQACLDGALDRREPWGVWGGQLLHQGEVIARKRPRGRPRKNIAA